MERTVYWFQPNSLPRSLIYALFLHAAILGAVCLYVSALDLPKYDSNSMTVIDLGGGGGGFSGHDRARKVMARAPQPEIKSPQKMPEQNKGPAIGAQASASAASGTGSSGTGIRSGPGSGDGIASPYFKIKPNYPRAARDAGVEGWVQLKVDVNEKGEVENAHVIAGVERGYFENEALRAVEKWKYRPFLDASGKPVRKQNQVVRVEFKLMDSGYL